MTEREALDAGTGFRKNSWAAFKYVLPFLRPQLRRLILVCLIDVSVVLLNLTIPWFGKSVIDNVLPQRNWNAFWVIAVSIAGLLLVVHFLAGMRTFLYNTTEQLLQLDIRRQMYGHLQKLSMETIDALPVGQHQFRISTDADRIAHMLVRILPTLIMLVEFALILATAIYVDPILTGIVALFLIPWTVLFIWVTHYGRVLDRRRLRLCELRDAGVLQATSSFFTIKSLGRTDYEVRRHNRVSVALQRVANQGYLILVGFEFATQRLIPFLKTTTIYLYLARNVVMGQMTLGMTVPMIAYLGRLSFPLERIVNFGCWIWQTMVSAERMMQVLETKPSITDKENAVPCREIVGNIEIQNVTFERAGVGEVLTDVSIKLSPATTTAIVGPSGSGKSTLVSLVLRLIDPSQGRVLVDGVDLRDLKRDTYLNQIGTVMQETYLFAGTLAENLLIAKPDATEEEMMEAVEQAELTKWVATLPNGLYEDLDGGSALSAGQKQRIGIARAILVKPRLLVLDEPTSALDAETEGGIMATIKRLSQNVTTLIVTHRLDTIRHADHIIVLEAGVIAEQGTHEDLLRTGGQYGRMRELFRGTGDRPEVSEVVTE